MDNQSQEIADLLREQNQLLKKHLWRLRFSLFSLLVLTTVTCITLGYSTYRTHFASTATIPASASYVTFQATPTSPKLSVVGETTASRGRPMGVGPATSPNSTDLF